MKYKFSEQKIGFSYKLKMNPFVHIIPLNVGCHWGRVDRLKEENRF